MCYNKIEIICVYLMSWLLLFHKSKPTLIACTVRRNPGQLRTFLSLSTMLRFLNKTRIEGFARREQLALSSSGPCAWGHESPSPGQCSHSFLMLSFLNCLETNAFKQRKSVIKVGLTLTRYTTAIKM